VLKRAKTAKQTHNIGFPVKTRRRHEHGQGRNFQYYQQAAGVD